jgi:WD40 repeat protein
VLDVPADGADGLVFGPDGKTLAAVSRSDPEVFVWNVDGSKTPAEFAKRYSRPRPRLFGYFWDSFPGIFQEHAYVPQAVFFTPQGMLIAFGHDSLDSTTVLMWQVR